MKATGGSINYEFGSRLLPNTHLLRTRSLLIREEFFSPAVIVRSATGNLSLRRTSFSVPPQVFQDGFDGNLGAVKPALMRFDDLLLLLHCAEQVSRASRRSLNDSLSSLIDSLISKMSS